MGARKVEAGRNTWSEAGIIFLLPGDLSIDSWATISGWREIKTGLSFQIWGW